MVFIFCLFFAVHVLCGQFMKSVWCTDYSNWSEQAVIFDHYNSICNAWSRWENLCQPYLYLIHTVVEYRTYTSDLTICFYVSAVLAAYSFVFCDTVVTGAIAPTNF